MKCRLGFLTVKDEITKKVVPFFVKVRRKDIISDIFDYNIIKVTGIYKKEKIIHSLDSVTIYNQGEITSDDYFDYSTNYKDTGEAIFKGGKAGFRANIVSKFFIDGTCEQFGTVTFSEEDDREYEILLPYVHIDEEQITPDIIQVTPVIQSSLAGTSIIENYHTPIQTELIKKQVTHPTLIMPNIMGNDDGEYFIYYCIRFTNADTRTFKFFTKRRRNIEFE